MKNLMFKTKIMICVIILLGFLVNLWINYNSTIKNYTDDIEHVSSLTSEGIFYKIKMIFDEEENTIGVEGVSLKIKSLQQLLLEYEQEFDVKTYLIDKLGKVEISTFQTGEKSTNLFDFCSYPNLKESILDNANEKEQLTYWVSGSGTKTYVVSQYIPELSWHLVVEHDNRILVTQMNHQIMRMCLIAVCVIIGILLMITYIIRRYNEEVDSLTGEVEREKAEAFRKATEQLYDNIYELNITKNCANGKGTEQYFESLGISGKTPLNQALKVVAEKQIKEEYRKGYLELFNPERVFKEYEAGNTKFNYEFLMSEDGVEYHWMVILARIYYSSEDESLCMFTYRKNIDSEKMQELKMMKQIEMDAMTKIFNKATVQRYISNVVSNSRGMYALLVFDIDEFKQVNDNYGHAFGDYVITEFAGILKKYFHTESDIIGRVGGDEFVVLTQIIDEDEAEKKARNILQRLDTECTKNMITCKISASIGVAISPNHGKDYDTLFNNADKALYQMKKNGRNGFCFYQK